VIFLLNEELDDDELSEDGLHKEIERSKAMANIASKIIDNAQLGLQAEKFKAEYGSKDTKLPAMLENK
jgi:hypothetical protein